MVMGWASGHIAKLQAGETVSFRPRGQSMRGKIRSGQLCTVEPLTDEHTLKKGTIVLCKVRSSEYLHLIKGTRGSQFLIGNNVGGTNGWISRHAIFGVLVGLE